MKTSSAKNKGRKLQQWVRDQIREKFFLPADDVQSRSMGAQGTDIMLSKTAAEILPFAIECKNTQNLSLWAAWKQANENKNESTPFPLLIVKRNNEQPLAILDAELFFEILKDQFIRIKASG